MVSRMTFEPVTDADIKAALLAHFGALGWLAEANQSANRLSATVDARDGERRIVILVDSGLDEYGGQPPTNTFADLYTRAAELAGETVEAAIAVNDSPDARSAVEAHSLANDALQPVHAFLVGRSFEGVKVCEYSQPDGREGAPGDSSRRLIAAYIADIARRFEAMDGEKAELYRRLGITKAAKVNRKTLREEVWYVWHSHTRPAGGKYSRLLRWSPAAIAARHADPKAPLVIDHVLPFARFAERLEPAAVVGADAVEALLNEIEFVIITAEEDRAVSAAGYRDKLPDDSEDPFTRYRPLGLTRSDFRSPGLPSKLG